MKTRQEMIYDFMLVLASNLDRELDMLSSWEDEDDTDPEEMEMVYAGILYRASKLADIYLGSLE